MKKFEASFESLREYECPDWFRDVKFGIWSHWGPQSVPMYGDWYARNMYIEGTSQYLYHIRHYGHPSEFGYKDLVQLWKAEKFNPEELMKLYYKAGARYFVAQAMHHDHFFNFDSAYNRFNSVQMGPKKDICMLWKKAAEKYNLPFGLTEHMSASFSWWRVNKGCDKTGPYKGVPYDGNDPAYKDFYFENGEHNENRAANDFAARPWYTSNVKFHEYWLKVMKELVDKFEPDLLYSDGGLPFHTIDAHNPLDVEPEGEDYRTGLEAVSYLYNKSVERNGYNRAVYNQKDKNPRVYKIGVLDIEKSQLPDILPDPWQTDTCIGNWFYDVRQKFKTTGHVIEMLVDIISKNGTMLLNILQKPDGTIDYETKYLLEELGKWFQVCSEGVYGTRPWKVSGEGETKVNLEGFKEEKAEWNPSDFRFTQKDGAVYAFMLRKPENGVAILKSFDKEEISEVELLGYGKVSFTHSFGVLMVQLPQNLPTSYINCLKITVKH